MYDVDGITTLRAALAADPDPDEARRNELAERVMNALTECKKLLPELDLDKLQKRAARKQVYSTFLVGDSSMTEKDAEITIPPHQKLTSSCADNILSYVIGPFTSEAVMKSQEEGTNELVVKKLLSRLKRGQPAILFIDGSIQFPRSDVMQIVTPSKTATANACTEIFKKLGISGEDALNVLLEKGATTLTINGQELQVYFNYARTDPDERDRVYSEIVRRVAALTPLADVAAGGTVSGDSKLSEKINASYICSYVKVAYKDSSDKYVDVTNLRRILRAPPQQQIDHKILSDECDRVHCRTDKNALLTSNLYSRLSDNDDSQIKQILANNLLTKLGAIESLNRLAHIGRGADSDLMKVNYSGGRK